MGSGSRIGEIVERLLEMQPRLQRNLLAPLPDELARKLGPVTPHQLEALGCLRREGSTMRDFASAVGISGAAATALANRMIRRGLAERRYDDSDRRTVWLAPTAQALRTLEAVQAWRRQSMTRVVERLDSAQVVTFLEVLGALAGAEPSRVEEPPPPSRPH